MSVDEPVDTGAVAPAETDAFLDLMCEAFRMKFEEARPIFYSDPYFEYQNKRVLRIAGEIVSCLTVVERHCRLGASILRLAGIAGVATRSDSRRKGYASRLLTETVRSLAESGFHAAALFPAQRGFYRALGWETAGSQVTARVSAESLRGLSASGRVFKAVMTDAGELSHLYDEYSRARAIHCLRDAKRWSYLLTYLPESFVVRSNDGSLVGYALVDVQINRDADTRAETQTGSHYRLLEMICTTREASRAIRRHLGDIAGSSNVEYTAPVNCLRQNGFPAAGEEQPSFMARILDWPLLLAELARNWTDFHGELGVGLTDSILSQRPRAAIIHGGNGRPEIEEIDPAELSSRCRDMVVGDVCGWSPVVLGHRGALHACNAGALKASSAAALEMADQLFPERSPFLPTADHF